MYSLLSFTSLVSLWSAIRSSICPWFAFHLHLDFIVVIQTLLTFYADYCLSLYLPLLKAYSVFLMSCTHIYFKNASDSFKKSKGSEMSKKVLSSHDRVAWIIYFIHIIAMTIRMLQLDLCGSRTTTKGMPIFLKMVPSR